MAEINLLPVSVNSKNATTKVATISKKIGIGGSVVVLIAIVIYACVYGFFYIKGNVTTASIETVENQIKAQEQTEQKFVLLRDRATKASSILAKFTSLDEMVMLSDIVGHLPEGVTLRESKILPSELSLTIQADQSLKLTEFVRSLTESGKYAQIESVSMDFTAKDQYISVYRLVLAQAQ
jgi:hypothetical protein